MTESDHAHPLLSTRSLIDRSARFALLRLLFQLLAFVMQFATARKPEQHLGSTPREVNVEGHEGQTLLFDLADQATNLVAIQQQLARP
jgi:hypothetical protein